MKSKSNSGEDRISVLPKALICHILSFLPTIQALRTTVLSKRWNNMWASVTTLDFDDDRDSFFWRDDDYLCRRLDFIIFVNRVFLFRDSVDIHKFKLRILDLPDYDCFEDWICIAARRNVAELHLSFAPEGKNYEIPRSVFQCKSLRALRLELNDNPFTSDNYPPPGCFRNLKFLHVTFNYPDEVLAEYIFSYCPVVEDIIIDGWASGMYVFNVCAPELKTLTVCLEDPDEIEFDIDAPNLEKLVLKSVSLSNYNLEKVKSLVSASVSFKDISAYEVPSFSTCATALLAGISNVKYLSLSTHSFEVSHLPAAFINLKKLDLLLHKRKYWELMVELLDRAPKLEDIVLEDKTECDNEYSELAWTPPEVVPMCLLSQVKTIKIKGFKGQRVEMGVAKYLLNNGHLLNELTLYTGLLHTEAEEMYKEFLMFHRAMSCQVKFIKM